MSGESSLKRLSSKMVGKMVCFCNRSGRYGVRPKGYWGRVPVLIVT